MGVKPRHQHSQPGGDPETKDRFLLFDPSNILQASPFRARECGRCRIDRLQLCLAVCPVHICQNPAATPNGFAGRRNKPTREGRKKERVAHRRLARPGAHVCIYPRVLTIAMACLLPVTLCAIISLTTWAHPFNEDKSPHAAVPL